MHNSSKPKVLFLFRELAGYFISCLRELTNRKFCDIEVVYWPVNAEAPLSLDNMPDIKWTKREDWNELEYKAMDKNGEFQCVIVSGWGDAGYNDFIKCQGMSKKILAFDTQWEKSPKLWLGSIWLRWKWRKYFDGAWVPGERQAQLARALGFSESEIERGCYVADLHGIALQDLDRVNEKFKIGVVARLVHEKGFPEVVEVLVPFLNQHVNWEIDVMGTGPLKEQMPLHGQIKYHGFVQPAELKNRWKDWDVFVLASRYEPWGVVVHEAVGAGLPVILSEAVGAGDEFVISDVNGWIIPKGDFSSLGVCLEQIAGMSLARRKQARAVSLEKSRLINHEQWCQTIKKWTN